MINSWLLNKYSISLEELLVNKTVLKSALAFSISYVLYFLCSISIKNDLPEVWQIGFQDSASQGMTGIIEFHNSIFFFLILILLGVFWILGVILYLFNKRGSGFIHLYWNHGTAVELIWTVTPALILIFISQFSFKFLYILDEVMSSNVTIKVTGNQ